MPTYTVTPQDVLFFRDGRPMTANAGSGGHGARWPEPSIIFDALHSALHRAFPAKERGQFQAWEHSHFFGRNGRYPARGDDSKRTHRFGSLATVGPFPSLAGAWLFPCPADVTQRDSAAPDLLPLQERQGQCNLPQPALYPVVSRAEHDKEGPSAWWNKSAIERYLGEKPTAEPLQLADDDIMGGEWNIGIEIDSATESTGRGAAAGKIYAAQYLRLREGVTMGVHAQMPVATGKPASTVEALKELFPEDGILICGGQRRACQVHETPQFGAEKVLPRSAAVTGRRVKWLLLSPAVFPAISNLDGHGALKRDRNGQPIAAHPGGWLPNWIEPITGQVLLKKGRLRGGSGLRENRRAHIQSLGFIDCRLVAACVAKPIPITGWSERLHLIDEPNEDDPTRKTKGARPTLLAVPAGATYYFEGPDAATLSDALSWHGSRAENPSHDRVLNRRSGLLGEKGFGLGVCGPWQFFEEASKTPTT